MPVFNPWIPAKVLITARTYPVPAKKGIEVSCTAGITDDGRWIRLFPVPYRFLADDKRFRKYQWIDVRVSKSSDHRPESFRLDRDSMRIVSDPLPTADGWKARKDIITPLESPSLCWLQAERDQHHFPTLGFFKPKRIKRLIIEPVDAQWSLAELARLRQETLFEKAPAQELEKLAYKFTYEFDCDDPACHGHSLSCTDWELGQSYRKWTQSYADWEAQFRQKYEHEMIERFDTHFFVGTIHQHPNRWIIVGLFYPLKQTPKAESATEQMPLF